MKESLRKKKPVECPGEPHFLCSDSHHFIFFKKSFPELPGR